MIKEIRRRRPTNVYMEPPCTWFSALLNMKWKKMPRHVREHAMKLAIALLEFSLLIMRIQLLAGRAFVLEHPLAATSWTHPWIQRSLAEFPRPGLPILTSACSGW